MNWSGRWDSNPRRLAWEASTLPLSYARSIEARPNLNIDGNTLLRTLSIKPLSEPTGLDTRPPLPFNLANPSRKATNAAANAAPFPLHPRFSTSPSPRVDPGCRQPLGRGARRRPFGDSGGARPEAVRPFLSHAAQGGNADDGLAKPPLGFSFPMR